MLRIAKLTELTAADLHRLSEGYTTTEKYHVTKTETEHETQITLTLVPLDPPFVKRWGQDPELEDHYHQAVQQGLSLGLYDGSKLVGLALAEKKEWNRTLWVWEFHIGKNHRRQGHGKRLMSALTKIAKENDCRVMVCETQNTNLPAIRFYRAAGFEIDALDLSYYTNSDPEDYEVALFMKKKLT